MDGERIKKKNMTTVIVFKTVSEKYLWIYFVDNFVYYDFLPFKKKTHDELSKLCTLDDIFEVEGKLYRFILDKSIFRGFSPPLYFKIVEKPSLKYLSRTYIGRNGFTIFKMGGGFADVVDYVFDRVHVHSTVGEKRKRKTFQSLTSEELDELKKLQPPQKKKKLDPLLITMEEEEEEPPSSKGPPTPILKRIHTGCIKLVDDGDTITKEIETAIDEPISNINFHEI